MTFSTPTAEQIERLRRQAALLHVRVVIADAQNVLHELNLQAADADRATEKALRGLSIVGYQGLRVISCDIR